MFKSDLAHNLYECDKSSFYDFTSCSKEILDKFAPLKKLSLVALLLPRSTFFVKGQKQVKRQAERLYNKTRLTIHKDIFKF